MNFPPKGEDFVTSGWIKLLRTLPIGTHGKWRLARRLIRQHLAMRDVPIRDKFGCVYTVPCLQEPIGFSLLVDGVYEPQLIQAAFNLLKPGSVVVDVGASIGAFTLPICTAVGSTGTVLAIEASPSIYPYLRGNVRANNLQNVILENCAVADRDNQDVDFYEAPIDHFGMGSLAPQFHDQPIRVPSATLDALLLKYNLSHVDVVKVDVEGYEAAVFSGAQKLLSSKRAPTVFFEFADWAETRRPGGHASDSQEILRAFGYKIWPLSSFSRKREPQKGVIAKGFQTLVGVKQGPREGSFG